MQILVQFADFFAQQGKLKKFSFRFPCYHRFPWQHAPKNSLEIKDWFKNNWPQVLSRSAADVLSCPKVVSMFRRAHWFSRVGFVFFAPMPIFGKEKGNLQLWCIYLPTELDKVHFVHFYIRVFIWVSLFGSLATAVLGNWWCFGIGRNWTQQMAMSYIKNESGCLWNGCKVSWRVW